MGALSECEGALWEHFGSILRDYYFCTVGDCGSVAGAFWGALLVVVGVLWERLGSVV